MPTYQKTLTGTAQKICDPNPQRTALTIANRDDTDHAHISDSEKLGTTRNNSFIIFAETYISLTRPADEPQKAYYGICEGGKTVIICILEAFGDVPLSQPPEPSPQDPFQPTDAPPMERVRTQHYG